MNKNEDASGTGPVCGKLGSAFEFALLDQLAPGNANRLERNDRKSDIPLGDEPSKENRQRFDFAVPFDNTREWNHSE
jgi:hypothetical protein